MKAKPDDKQSLHAAIRAAVVANSGKRVTFRNFLVKAGWSPRGLYRHYSGWEEALKGAGYAFPRYHEQATPEALLELWGEVARKLGRAPSTGEFDANSRGQSHLFRRRFGSWLAVPEAFQRFARVNKEWADVVAMLDEASEKKKLLHPGGARYAATTGEPLAAPLQGRPVFGDQLDFPSLRHAPSNELGVVYLFGIMAERMGFAVERMQGGFPDCVAKRRFPGGKWQEVAIEFEYQSRNFRDHRHNPRKCDIIVCWNHNWPECPGKIEVIELSEEIKRLCASKTNGGLVHA